MATKTFLRQVLKAYLKNRPLFLGIIRAKEAELYQPYLPLKRPVLDFGCGDGFFAKVTFANKSHPERSEGSRRDSSPDQIGVRMTIVSCSGNKLKFVIPELDIGLDLEGSGIDEARDLGIYKKLVVYDGKRIPFPDSYFSTIVSNCVLEHIPNLEKTLLELKRVLKPDGLLLTTVMAKNWQEYLFGNLFFGNFYKRWMRKIQKHHQILTEKEWSLAFTKAGFQTEEVRGYLDKRASRWLDFLHYISVGSLVSYKLTRLFGRQAGRWVLFPWQYDLIPVDRWLANLIHPNLTHPTGETETIAPVGCDTENSAALFFVLKKR